MLIENTFKTVNNILHILRKLILFELQYIPFIHISEPHKKNYLYTYVILN